MPTLQSLLRKIDRQVASINDIGEADRQHGNTLVLMQRAETPFMRQIYKYAGDRLLDRIELLQGASKLDELQLLQGALNLADLRKTRM